MPGSQREARAKLGLPLDGKLVGIIATLRSWKGHRYLIEALVQLADRDTRLLIVGGGPQQEALQAQVTALNLGDRVVMPGNQRDVLPWLQALDIFALPSYANEGVPQAILQAMLCGLPVISTPVGSIQEAVQHQRTGLIVSTHNTDELRQALEHLLADPVLCHTLGQAAREAALAKFGLDAMLDKMETVFAHARHG